MHKRLTILYGKLTPDCLAEQEQNIAHSHVTIFHYVTSLASDDPLHSAQIGLFLMS